LGNIDKNIIDEHKRDISEFLKFTIFNGHEMLYKKIIYYLEQVARSSNSEITKLKNILNNEKNLKNKNSAQYVEIELSLVEQIYLRDQLFKIKQNFINNFRDNISVFSIYNEKVDHKIKQIEKERLNLFQKITAIQLTLYFIIFSTFIYILIVVFINSVLNNRIADDK